MSRTPALTDATLPIEVEQSTGLTLVDFWAPWCAPCLVLSPVVERIAAAYGGRVRVFAVNVDDSAGTMARFGVRSIPTLLLFEDGHVVASLVGAVPQSRIETLLDAHLVPRAA